MSTEPDERRRRRKERILHTRISEDLEEALQDAARRLRVPVSNLVRNVLEDVFDAVETVTENVGRFVEEVVDETGHVSRRFDDWRERVRASRPAAEPEPDSRFAGISAWQPIVVHAPRECASCRRGLHRGESAYLGLGEAGATAIAICKSCLDSLR